MVGSVTVGRAPLGERLLNEPGNEGTLSRAARSSVFAGSHRKLCPQPARALSAIDTTRFGS